MWMVDSVAVCLVVPHPGCAAWLGLELTSMGMKRNGVLAELVWIGPRKVVTCCLLNSLLGYTGTQCPNELLTVRSVKHGNDVKSNPNFLGSFQYTVT